MATLSVSVAHRTREAHLDIRDLRAIVSILENTSTNENHLIHTGLQPGVSGRKNCRRTLFTVFVSVDQN